MIKVSFYEAKTHLAELLRKEKTGKPPQRRKSVKDTVDALKRFRSENTLQGLSLKDMIEEEHR